MEWFKKPVRMIRRDFISDFKEYKNLDLDQFAREIKDKWHANCEWIMATPGCAPGMGQYVTFNSDKFEKAPGLGDFDIIREYLPYARKYDFKVLAYLNMHWYPFDFADKHPDWEQLLEGGIAYGRKNPLYGTGTTFCVNSPWREWAFELIKEVVSLGIDGVFLDGPVVFPGACYCKYCRKKFLKKTNNNNLPKFEDWSDPAWRGFTIFRSDSWSGFLKDAREAVRSVNPDAVIFLNGGSFLTPNLYTARDTFKTEQFQDFTGAEQFYHVSEKYNSPYKTINLGRFLSAGDNPAVVFTHHTLSAWHYIPLCKTEMDMALAQTVASGSNPWFAVFMNAMKFRAEEALEAVGPFYRFLEQNESVFTETKPDAEINVLFSNKTAYNYISVQNSLFKDTGSGEETDLITDTGSGLTRDSLHERRTVSAEILDREYEGSLDAFSYSHQPVRVIWDEHISRLKDGNVLILPNTACLSDSQINKIIDYVDKGGALIATFEAGFYDEKGCCKKRKRWFDFLGIDKVEGAFEPSSFEEYIKISNNSLSGFKKDMIIPRTYNALKICPVLEKDTDIPAYFMNETGSPYAEFNGVSPYPVIVSNNRAKGKVVYIAAPLFASIVRFRLNDHIKLVEAVLRYVNNDNSLQIETNAPGSLIAEIRSNKRGTVLHLINISGDMKRPIGSFVSLNNIELSIRTSRPLEVINLHTKGKIPFTYTDNRVIFKIKKITDYTLVLLSR